MAKYQGKGRSSSKRTRRGLTLGMSIAGVIVVAAAIGWFAYRASADLPGEKFADLGNEHIQAASDPPAHGVQLGAADLRPASAVHRPLGHPHAPDPERAAGAQSGGRRRDGAVQL